MICTVIEEEASIHGKVNPGSLYVVESQQIKFSSVLDKFITGYVR